MLLTSMLAFSKNVSVSVKTAMMQCLSQNMSRQYIIDNINQVPVKSGSLIKKIR